MEPPGRRTDRKRTARQRQEKTMKSGKRARLIGWWLAGLVLISVEAHAESGFTITRSQESAITVGMGTADVQRVLGRPERAVRYRNAPGPIWTYRVVDPLFGKTEFNVEFSADDRVIATGEVVIG